MEFSKVSGVRTDALLSLYIDGQKCEQERGELQLADYGISGIPVFQISGRVSRLLYQGKEPYLKIDVMPDHTKEQVMEEIRQEAESYGMTVEAYAANGYEPPKRGGR